MPAAKRDKTTGPPPAVRGAKSKSAPHVPPDGQPALRLHTIPSFVPPTQTVGHVPPGQSRSVTQGCPSFDPPLHCPRRRAKRSTVYGASAEPKSVITSGGTVGSASGSKIGGSLPPSGV